MQWLSAQELALLAGISERKARLAMARASDGKAWRGSILLVRIVNGKGGRAGQQYQVRVDSLPADLQAKLKAPLKALAKAVGAPLKGQAATRDHRLKIVRRLEDAPRGTREAVLREEADREGVHPETIRKWLRDHQRDGMAALGRRQRKDTGATKIIVTMKVDAFLKAQDRAAELPALAERLQGYIRANHKNLEGRSAIAMMAGRFLEGELRKLGIEPEPGLCKVPLHTIGREQRFRKVGIYAKDRKAFQDNAPHIVRTIEGLEPMDIVVGDVHPLDFLFPEQEGFSRYAKAICWADVATKRIWVTVVFLPKGEGIRNEHVIASFLEMVAVWGLPKALYLDNGSEYNFAEFIEDALKLANKNGERVVINATPYNARAKIIEGIFAIFIHLLKKIIGYIGGDRTKSKVANIGKEPVSFPDREQFREVMAAIVTQYHAKPQSGQLAGRSPMEAFNGFVAAGWHKTQVDQDAFFTVFCKEEARTLRNGYIRVDGGLWTCDALQECMDDRVSVLRPKYEKWPKLPVRDASGSLIGYAEPAQAFGFLDSDGAKESARRQKLHRAAVVALGKQAPTIDPIVEILDFHRDSAGQIAAPAGAFVTASDEARTIAKAVKETPAQRRAREAEDRRREEERDAELLRMNQEMLRKMRERRAEREAI